MGKQLTFKQYLESKQKLREAITNIPQRTARYSVKKYCKMVVGESKDDKQYISLKPNQTILVEWSYDDPTNPTVVKIQYEDVTNINEDDEYETFWEGNRLQKWLEKNTREQN